MHSQNLCERSVSDKALIQVLKITIADLKLIIKEKDAKIERLEGKISYLNRCLTTDVPDTTCGESQR